MMEALAIAVLSILGVIVTILISSGSRYRPPRHARTPRYRRDPDYYYEDRDTRYNSDNGNGCLTVLAIIGVIAILAIGLIIVMSITVQAGIW